MKSVIPWHPLLCISICWKRNCASHPPESDTEVAQAFVEIKTDLVRLDDLVQDYLSLVRTSTVQRDPVALHPHTFRRALLNLVQNAPCPRVGRWPSTGNDRHQWSSSKCGITFSHS